jgi:SNF2 family DNA or RNA helicase
MILLKDPIFPDELEADEKESKKKIKKLSEEDEKKNKMINRYGSKLTRLSSWLKELFSDDPKHRAILFSKFTDYLRAVEELLNIAGVPCAFLEGYSHDNTTPYNTYTNAHIVQHGYEQDENLAAVQRRKLAD